MGRFDRAVAQLIDGAKPTVTVLLSRSRDLETDVGEDGLWVVTTCDRVFFLAGPGFGRPTSVHWWFWRRDLIDMTVDRRWQRSWYEKAIEFVVTFHLCDGVRFTGVILAAGGGKRDVRRLCDELGFHSRV